MSESRPRPPVDLAAGLEFSPRQQEILDGLESIVLDEGFRNFTVQALAERLHCSRRTLYELAPSRDELVLLVLDRFFRRIGRAVMAEVNRYDDASDRLHTYVTRTNEELQRCSPRLLQDMVTHRGVSRLVEEHAQFVTAVCGQLIQEGLALRAFRGIDADVTAEVLGAAARHLRDPEVLARLGISNTDAMRQLIKLVFAGLSGEVTRQPRRRSRG
jgi:AcrR family transcriptional regulator